MRLRAFNLNEPLPELKETHALTMLRPWVDVGNVGTQVLSWLETRFNAKDLGRLARPGDLVVIAGGSQQTKTGLTISVLVGDYIGIDNGNDTSSLSRDVSGSGVYDASVAFPFTNRAFNLTASRTISLYGTGVEAGGGVAIPIMMHHYKMMRS